MAVAVGAGLSVLDCLAAPLAGATAVAAFVDAFVDAAVVEAVAVAMVAVVGGAESAAVFSPLPSFFVVNALVSAEATTCNVFPSYKEGTRGQSGKEEKSVLERNNKY